MKKILTLGLMAVGLMLGADTAPDLSKLITSDDKVPVLIAKVELAIKNNELSQYAVQYLQQAAQTQSQVRELEAKYLEAVRPLKDKCAVAKGVFNEDTLVCAAPKPEPPAAAE